ncbi:MAG: hypothetical protein JXR27_00185 [Paludibacteraceae bacterium]|nr:hypothetical protein [Paludibacteraceae bacterium]
MKIKLIILTAILGSMLSSCNLEGESNYTPMLYFVTGPILQNGDSLEIYRTDQLNVFRLDTIAVGDTVSFFMYATGYSNNLTAYYMKQSTDSATEIILPRQSSMDSVFTVESDYKTGKFIMGGNSTSLYFPFKYVAKKAEKNAKITFTIISDAQFTDMTIGSNTTSFELITPTALKPDTTDTE